MADTIKTETKDTIVVIVKHENAGNFFERTGKPFKKGCKAIENGVTSGYQTVALTESRAEWDSLSDR